MSNRDQPDIRISIEDFSDEVRAAYLALLPHQSGAVAAGKLDWKFRQNPAGSGQIAVARKGREIIGLNAFMAGTFDDAAGATLQSFQSMDTIVTPAARGLGIFNRMVAQFHDTSTAGLIYGFPNMSSSPGFFGKLRWQRIGPAPMLVKPLRTGLFLKRLHRRMPDFAVPSWSGRLPLMEEVTQFDERVDAVWSHFAERNGVRYALRRDAAFLNWRLFAHPSASYRAFTIGHRAYAAYCIEEKHGGRIGYIMDAFGEDHATWELIRGIAMMIRAAGADAIFAWNLPHCSNHWGYVAAGFLSLPDRIRPIRLNFGGRPLRAELAGFDRPGAWHISYLDSDTV